MTMEDIFVNMAVDLANELSNAEAELNRAEADCATAIEQQLLAAEVRQVLEAALTKVRPDSLSAERLRARIREQQHIETHVAVRPRAMVVIARRNADVLRAELQDVEMLAAPVAGNDQAAEVATVH